MATINGTAGNDTLTGTSDNDTINGLGGNDLIDGRGGNDTLDGGTGNDTLLSSSVVDSSDLLIGGEGDDSLFGGGNGSDTLQGGGGDDILQGGWGSDIIAGDAGNDLISSRGGNDTLTGGAGADGFMLAVNPHPVNAVLITDLASGVDKLRLEAFVMPALGRGGNFVAGDARFHAAAEATGGHDADDRIVYNTSTGELWYDADGNGAGAAQLIATLQGAAALTATDIAVDHGEGPGQVITGTAGNDSLVGTFGNDTLVGLAGKDTLEGSLGDDRLDGGTGDDWLIGNDGADLMIGGEGNDTLESGFVDSTNGEHDPDSNTMNGGLGDDYYRVDDTNDVLIDDGGIDSIAAIDMDWTLGTGFENLVLNNDAAESGFTGIGNELDNHISVSYAGSRLEGRGGNDTLIGNSGNISANHLLGEEGDDSLVGAGWDDTLDGGAGNDTLRGGAEFDDFVFSVAPGAANADQILGFDSSDDEIGFGDEIVLDGAVHASSGPSGNFAAGDARFAANSTGTAQDASDRVIYDTSNGQLWYDADGNGAGAAQLIATLQGAPTLSAVQIEVINGSTGGQVINGTSGNDTLSGTAGDDTINGLDGNDLFQAGSTGGADVIDGGAGRDSIEFASRATSAMVVDFTAGTITGGSSGTISFAGIERVVAGNFNDSLTGNAAAQNLAGQAGADTLWGAGGIDTLWGGTGADTFAFRETGTANADRISDWTSGSDKLLLDGAVMSALGASGNFAAGDARFWSSSSGTAHDADDRVIFNTTTRQVFYDADGSGSGAAQLIATLQSGATLVATDIVAEGGGPTPIVGTAGDDTLRGTGGDDTIDGLGGNDVLFGESGADLLRGGDGNDTLWHGDGAAPHEDSVADTLDGGFGDDVYHVSGQDGDVILDDPGGIDTVFAWRSSWTLGPGLENLELADDVGVSSDGTGNELDNRISSASEGGTLLGLGGNDTLVVENAQNTVIARGGDGDDTLLGGVASANLFGDAGNDLLVSEGGLGDLTGGAGNDTLETFGADNLIFSVAPGSANADQVIGFRSGENRVVLDGNAHANLGPSGSFVAGDARFWSSGTGTAHDADDRVIYNTSNGQLWYDADGNAAGAAQLIATLSGAPSVVATDIEVINGSAGGQVINGTEGDDGLVGGDGDDTVNGLGGHDNLFGGSGDDLLDGGEGHDGLHGDEGNDTLLGGAGNDFFFLETRPGRALGQDVLHGGSGIDTLVFLNDTGGVTVDAASGTFAGPRPGDGGTFTSIEKFDGTIFADSITGDASANVIDGRGGDDTLDGGGGDDTLRGAHSLAGDELLIGGDGNDSLVGASSGGGIDTLRGGAGDDILHGSSGNDVVAGDAGNDLFWGNSGNDTLTGGAGADSFMFASHPHPAHADLITDFASGVDKLRLEAFVMPALGRGGNFTAGDARFHAAAGASSGHDADDRIIYNTSTGELWYDADGNGAGAAQLIATLQGAPALTATDIAVDHGDGPGQAITGTAGNDSLVGTFGNDTLEGLAGNDTLEGSLGDDRLDGGTGNDWLIGNDGADLMIGGEGNDTLETGFVDSTGRHSDPDSNTMNGGLGDDHYRVDDTNDVLIDDGGIDTIDAVDMDWTLGAGFENLIIHNDFGEASQIGIGNELDNHIRASYAGSRLEGRGGNDTLIGNSGNFSVNHLLGEEGNDSLEGASEDDTLDGGAGNDTLAGGGSAFDDFVFSVAPEAANADRILDFGSLEDKIVLDGAVHANSGPSGNFAADDARFAANSTGTAQDASDRVVYNTSSGELWYDADGNGTGAAQLIATLSGAPNVVATDLEVINGSAGGQVINGTSGNDSLVGGPGNDTINGLDGNDTLVGLGGDDQLDGGAGEDMLDGGSGNDTYLITDSDPDQSTNFDVVLDAGGIDTVIGERWDVMDDGIENLTLRGSWGGNLIWPFVTGNGLNNIITNEETLFVMLDGGDGDDTLIGGDGSDRFFFSGASGNYGADLVDGRGDWDGIDFQDAESAVTIDFRAGSVSGGGTGGSGTVAFMRIEEAIGSRFDDRLVAHDGGGDLQGYLGNDTLIGGTGNDLLNGDGIWADHPPSEFGGDDQVFGGAGNDTLADWEGDDLLDGGSGDDVFFLRSEFGEQGRDTVLGGDGTDTVDSEHGRFADLSAGILETDSGVTTLSSIENLSIFLGDARILGSAGANRLSGGDGADTIEARAGDDTVYGDDSGRNLIPPIDFADRLLGEEGNDLLIGRWGNDTLEGGLGNDTLHGGKAPEDFSPEGDGDDALDGGAGNDSLVGSIGADRFNFTVGPGAANADFVDAFVSAEDQIVLDGSIHVGIGPSGNFVAGDARFWSSSSGTAHDADDRVIYNTSNGQLWYDADGNGGGARQLIATLQGTPSLAATDIAIVNGSGGGGQVINGTSGADTLTGTAGNDTINGLGGNDLVLAGSSGGADVINGGAGFDSIEFASRATSAMVVDFAAGTITGGSSGTISFTGIERVVASNFNDSLTGNGAAQNLAGQAGADTLWGAGGIDTLWGGGGADTFIFREMGTANADRVSDWASGSDKVHLDDVAFTSIGATGNFSAGDARFEANSTGTATDTNDRVVYNTSTGSLYYDADGSGSGAAQLIATFTGSPTILATDMVVV